MAHPLSIRFRDDAVDRSLRDAAAACRLSASAMAELLIDEGLRSRRHPSVVFRPGPSGRRACLAGGPDIDEVISTLLDGDVPPDGRVERAAELLGLAPPQIEAALGYYADYTAEIDREIAANIAAAEHEEARWRRQQDLLAR
jgi:hypothetical protein